MSEALKNHLVLALPPGVALLERVRYPIQLACALNRQLMLTIPAELPHQDLILTMYVDSRVTLLQRFARTVYSVKEEACRKIQLWFKIHNARRLVRQFKRATMARTNVQS